MPGGSRTPEAVRNRIERALNEADGPLTTTQIRSLFGSQERDAVWYILDELVEEHFAVRVTEPPRTGRSATTYERRRA